MIAPMDAFADFTGANTTDGVQTGLTRVELGRARNGLDLKSGAPDPRSFEYASGYACPYNTLGGTDPLCPSAVQACGANTPSAGTGNLDPAVPPRARRQQRAGSRLADRRDHLPGRPCSGQAGARSGSDPGRIPQHPVAKPTVHIQPEGKVTLVTLPTYFTVAWPEAGFQPGEADTLTMLGQRVQIRPTLDSYSHVFGDGTTLGPTTSAGGLTPVATSPAPTPRPGSSTRRSTSPSAASSASAAEHGSPSPTPSQSPAPCNR
jgi:hypothetical protein